MQSLEECSQKINEEKAQDQSFRAHTRGEFGVLPSEEANKEIVDRIELYKGNIMKALEADSDTKKKINMHKEQIQKLDKSKAELEYLIPKGKNSILNDHRG